MSFPFRFLKLSRSTWLSLIVTFLLVGAIAVTQYASLNTRDDRSSAQSAAIWIRSTPTNGFTVLDQTGAGYSGTTDYLYPIYNYQSIVLRAQPRNGFIFSNWQGCDAVSGADCGVNLNPYVSRTVIANYATANNVLYVYSNGASSGNVTFSGSQAGTGGTTNTFAATGYYYYRVITANNINTVLTAPPTAPSGEVFAYWGGACDSVNNGARQCSVSLSNGVEKGVVATYQAQAPQATVDVKANSTDGSITIASGGSATIDWSSTNASSCTASGSGWSGAKPTSGLESTGALTSSRTYSMTCYNSAGQASNTDTVTVNVSGTGSGQISADIKANNSDGPITISSGTSVTVSWSSSGAANCSVSPGGWAGTSGSQSSGNLSSSTTYTLSCTGASGSRNDSVTVNISAAPLANLSVSNFILSPATPTPGQTVTATINVLNNGNGPASGTFWVDLFSNQATNTVCGQNGQAAKSFTSLGAGISTGNFTLTFKAPSATGTYTARVFADSDCQIAESDDGNNQTVKAYTVSTTGSTGSSAPKVGTTPTQAGSSDIALTFAENPFLKGGMEITMQVDGTSVSQKAVLENKGGSFVLKTNNALSKNKTYTLKVYARNSLIQAINFNFTDNTKADIAKFTMGDFDRENSVADADVNALITNGTGNQDLLYDVNYDGVVNSVDYSLVLANLGKKG